jgi:tRNA 2-thiouridine synthesizing protein A
MAEIQADKVLDCLGLLCPIPVVQASRAIKEIAVDQVLEVIADDPGAPPDMHAWARQTGNELLDESTDNGQFHFWFRRTS